MIVCRSDRLSVSLTVSFALFLLVLAAPRNRANAADKPLKVFILAGQSNMEGHAHVRVLDYLGEDPATAPLLQAMKHADGRYREIPQTWISFLTSDGRGGNREVHGPLLVGYGSQGGRDPNQPGTKIGPELAFGIRLQQQLNEPILLIKVAWGGQSLCIDFRSPSSGPYPETEANKNRFDTPEKRAAIQAATGQRYREMVEHVQHVLKDVQRVCPDAAPNQQYQLAGFVWFQGWNDMVDRSTYPQRDQPGGYDQYSECLTHFIRDVRRDLDAPKMPFVIGVMGVGGPLQKESRYYNVHNNFRRAMSAPAERPEFAGNVFAVATADYWDERLSAIDEKREQVGEKGHLLRSKHPEHENADGAMTPAEIQDFLSQFEAKLITEEEVALEKRAKSNAAYHYLGSARIYSLIGTAFADALLDAQRDR